MSVEELLKNPLLANVVAVTKVAHVRRRALAMITEGDRTSYSFVCPLDSQKRCITEANCAYKAKQLVWVEYKEWTARYASDRTASIVVPGEWPLGSQKAFGDARRRCALSWARHRG